MRTLLFALILFQGILFAQAPCPRWGDARPGTLAYALNIKKTRMDIPVNYLQISVSEFLKFPDDSTGDGAAFELTGGYVIAVKKQGTESCNCKNDSARDFHLVVVPAPDDSDDVSKHIIVEITPGIRKMLNWTDQEILDLKNNYVNFYGFKFADLEHKNMSVKSNPNRITCWRGSINELHPVTKFVKLGTVKIM